MDATNLQTLITVVSSILGSLMIIIGYFLVRFIKTVDTLIKAVYELKESLIQTKADGKRGYDLLKLVTEGHERRLEKIEEKLV